MDVVRHLTARSTGPALAVFVEALDGTLPSDEPSTWQQRHTKTPPQSKGRDGVSMEDGDSGSAAHNETTVHTTQQQAKYHGWTEAKVAELLQLGAGLSPAKVSELLHLGALYSHTPNRQGAMVLSRALDPNAIISKGTYLRAYVLPKRFPNPTHPATWLVAMDQDLCVIDKPPNMYVVLLVVVH